MNTNTILQTYRTHKIITDDIINSIQTSRDVRLDMVNYFRHNYDRDFAIALLKQFIAIRKEERAGEMPFENLMFACYIVTLHHHIEDCLLICEAKYADFDAYCGLDVQLVVFSGAAETITFLATETTESAKKAFEYITECAESGDFDYLETYYAKENLPWYI